MAKDGVLELISVQLQGKKVSAGVDFIRGNTVTVL